MQNKDPTPTLVLHLTFGASCGYTADTWNVNTNVPLLFNSQRTKQISFRTRLTTRFTTSIFVKKLHLTGSIHHQV